MTKEDLKKAYLQLKKEIIDSYIPYLQDNETPEGLRAKSLRVIKKEIESITGVKNPISEKTLRKYFRSEDYDPSFNNVSYLAALWLINAKALTREECKKFYSQESRTSDVYWNMYTKTIQNGYLATDPGEVTEAETKQPLITATTPLTALYRSPDFEDLLERTSWLDKLYNKTEKSRIVVVDGISGVGKKSLVFTLQNKLISSGRYRHILWRKFEPNDSLQKLFFEVENIIPFENSHVNAKALHLTNYLKENQLLLILYGLEKIDEQSFENLFSILSPGTGNAQILLIRDNLTNFSFFPVENRITLQGLSREEISELCQKNNLAIDELTLIGWKERTGGIPFYINSLIKEKKVSVNDHDYAVIIADAEIDLDYKVKDWCKELKAEEKKLLQLISLYQISFSEADIQALSQKADINDYYKAFSVLKDYHIVYPVPHKKWQVLAPIAAFYSCKYEIHSQQKMHGIIADYLTQVTSPAQLKTLSRDQLYLQFLSISHSLQSSDFEKSTNILEAIIPLLKKHNFYPHLYQILTLYEKKKTNHNSHWKTWHLAHCCFVLGYFSECTRLLSNCINKSEALHYHRIDIDSGLSFFIKTFLLFSELVNTVISPQEAYKIIAESLSVFEMPEIEWLTRSHALTVLSGHLADLGNYRKSKEINETLLKEDYDGSILSKAINHTHIGIAEYYSKDYTMAETSLIKASVLFSEAADSRGIVWCSMHLILTKIKLKKKISVAEIKKIIEIKETGQLFIRQFDKWLETVNTGTTDNLIKELISEKLATARVQEEDVFHRTDEDRLKSLIVTVNRFMAKTPRNPFDLDTLINPISETDMPLGSVLLSSMIKSIRKDPYSYLEKLKSKKPQDIFLNNKINKAILGCLAMYEYQYMIINELILPNIDFIISLESNYDEIKIRYSRALHNFGDQDNAIRILGAVAEEHRHFFYLNTMANCLWKKGDRIKSESFYEFAGDAAKTTKEKGIHYHNQALRIYESQNAEKYEEAKNLCKQAINIRKEEHWFIKYPVSTLVLLEIETTDSDRVTGVVRSLKTNYNISYALLSNIIRNVKNNVKKKKLQKEFL